MCVLLGLMIPFLGTALGSAMVFFIKNKMSSGLQKLLLGFASGVMIAASVWSLLIPAIERAEEAGQLGWIPAAGGFALGVAFLLVLHNVIPHLHPGERDPEGLPSRWERPTLLFTAVTLHNIPEGMSIGAGFAIQDDGAVSMGLMLAVLIGLHNIPEGMAVTVPLVAGGMGRAKAILLTACSGLPMLIGAWLGVWLGDIGPLGLCCSLGFASGAMLYVVFGEIIPQSILMYRSRVPAILVVVGMLIGMCLIYL